MPILDHSPSMNDNWRKHQSKELCDALEAFNSALEERLPDRLVISSINVINIDGAISIEVTTKATFKLT